MRTFRPVTLALLPALALLGGCQSVFGIARSSQPDLILPKVEDPQQYAAVQLGEGRRLLDQQQYGQAIIAFRNSQRFSDLAAASHNGLAISYAQLGRADLAERYFLQAIAEAPADARFQGNLARLQAVMSGPMRYAQAPASLARVAVAWPAIGLARPLRQFIDPSSGTTVRIEAPTPQIVRISAREVFLAAPQRGDADPRRRNPNYRQALAR